MRQKILKELRREIRKDLAKEQDRFKTYLRTLKFFARAKILLRLLIKP